MWCSTAMEHCMFYLFFFRLAGTGNGLNFLKLHLQAQMPGPFCNYILKLKKSNHLHFNRYTFFSQHLHTTISMFSMVELFPCDSFLLQTIMFFLSMSLAVCMCTKRKTRSRGKELGVGCEDSTYYIKRPQGRVWTLMAT